MHSAYLWFIPLHDRSQDPILDLVAKKEESPPARKTDELFELLPWEMFERSPRQKLREPEY